jgi:beta propeller repeat protein
MRSKSRPWVQVFVPILLVLSFSTLGSVGPNRNTSAGDGPRFVAGELIVKLKEGVEPASSAALRALEARHPGTRTERLFPLLLDRAEIDRRNPARATRAPGLQRRPGLDRIYKITLGGQADVLRAVRDLQNDPGTEYAEPNFLMQASIVNDPYYSSSGSWGQPYADLWGVKKIRADLAWSQATGQGVVVAVIDTGLDYNHEDIRNRVWVNPGEDRNHNGVVDASDFNGRDDDHNGYVDDLRGWDFHNLDNNPADDHFHGTHVSGTIAAEGNNGLGIVGVAHQARIMPIKFLDDQGFGTSADGAASILYAAENGADVVNMSWGGPANQVTADAVADAYALGAVLVAAAGNSNTDAAGFSPATHPEVMAVASTDQNDVKSDFSNWGEVIDVAAPGGGSFDPLDTQQTYVNILSLQLSGGYFRLRGTSMASPHAAGVAALVLSRQPAASNGLVRAIVEGTAVDLGAPGFDIYSGYGRVDAQLAVNAAGSAQTVPELRVQVSPQKPVAAIGGPAPVNVKVENLGLVGTQNVSVELFDGDPALGGVLLRAWSVVSLPAGTSQTLTAYPTFSSAGVRTLFGFVDRAGAIAELTEVNNRHTARLGITTRTSFTETPLVTAGGQQLDPSMSGSVVVWEDHRNELSFPNGDIYAYNFATGVETAIAFDAVLTASPNDQRNPTNSGTQIVWQDTRNGKLDIYRFDTATMTTGQEELLTPYPEFTQHYAFPVIGGNRLLFKAPASYYDFDNPYGSGELSLMDLTTRQVTSLGIASQYDIDGDRIVYAGAGGIHVRDLTSGQDTVIGNGSDPALSGARGAWIGMDGATVFVRDLTTGLESVVPPGAGEMRIDLDISGDLVVWSQRTNFGAGYFSNWNIYARDLSAGLTYKVSNGEMDQYQPAVSGDRIVWQDWRGATDLYAATAKLFPAAVANLTGARATNKSARLNWSASPEPDVVDYVVYRSLVPGGPYTRIGVAQNLTYLDQNLTPGGTYYYRVAARNQGGWEGAFSVEVRVNL